MHKYVGASSNSATFSPAVEVHAPARWLHISGQVPRRQSGEVPKGMEAQADLVFANLAAVLQQGNMRFADVVGLTVYLVNREDGPVFDKVRTKWLDGAKPCSTKIFVSGFVDPDMLVEVQGIAAA